MIKEYKSEILTAIENNTLYDWLSANYWRLDTTTIFLLLKEFVYIHETRGDENIEGDKMELIENIKEYV